MDPATREARFAAVEAHADYRDALRHTPVVQTGLVELFVRVFVGTATGFVVCGVLLMLVFPSLITLLWLLVSCGFVVLSRRVLQQIRTYARTPIDRAVRVVAGVRTHVSTGWPDTTDGWSRPSSPTTSYYATLEDRDGTRTEHRVGPRTFGLLARGDIGVAYARARHLLEFRRFEV